MTRAIRSCAWPLLMTIAATAVACAGRATPETVRVAGCEIGDSSLVRDVLYFGRNRPTGGTVSDAEWRSFLDRVVTPRFPAGLTVVAANGQWRGQTGAVERERAEVLTVFHAGDEAARRAITEIIAEYKRRFQQEAVLRDRTPTCARFGAAYSSSGLPNIS